MPWKMRTDCRMETTVSLFGWCWRTQSKVVSILKRIKGRSLEFSAPYAERLVQELSLRTWKMITNTELPDSLWAEAMQHGKWLRKKLPSKSINQQLPLKLWGPSASIVDYYTLPTFVNPGFSLVYRPSTGANKKMLAHTVHTWFLEMESDERLCQTFNPSIWNLHIVRLADFWPC